jgi:putative ABC transport system permease protein
MAVAQELTSPDNHCTSNDHPMFKSYFTTGLRNLLKQRAYSFIKIAGLALGLAASLVIYLYIAEDLSYDRFHTKSSQIVRCLTIDNAEGVSSKVVGVTQPQLAPSAMAELPEVVNFVRFTGGGRYDLKYGDNLLKCESAFRVDPSVFDVFDFPLVAGSASEALKNPASIAITESLAAKIFGAEDPIGKTVMLNQTTELHVTAVLKDLPKNSHLQFDLLHTLVPGQNEAGLQQALQTWQSIFTFSYLLLDGPADVPDLNAKLKAISSKNNAFEFFTPVAQPLEDMHLYSKGILFESNANKSDVLNIYVLSTIATLILILAAVNFMNLVTARSAGRAKEVGMRKVIGAVRFQLIGQHLTESLLVTIVSGIIGMAVAVAVVPVLNNTYRRFADVNLLFEPSSLAMIGGLILVVGLLAGLYPAFVLSGFKPITVLKGNFKNSTAGIQLRKTLVVLQFTISIALMVGTGIVYQQMRFIYGTDLGYSRDQVISIQQSGAAVSRAGTLETELLRNENILSVGTSSSRIGQQLGRTNILPEGSTSETNIITSVMVADESFIPTMGMTMAAGRNFSLDYDDSLSIVINQEMVRLLNWDDAVGKKINTQTGPNPEDQTSYTVIGVVNDFHFATIRHKLEPLFILYNRDNGAMSIKVKSSNLDETLAYVEEVWKRVNPGTTFEYAFLDEQFDNLYRNEHAFANMFSHFTALAMVIAGLGLFALSAFTAEQRKKEIGIRKVLGASNATIFYRLSAEFVALILISFVLASVAAYFVMNAWLKDFQYSVEIGAVTFVWAGLASLLIALSTISFQSLRAAWSNPTESLRSE